MHNTIDIIRNLTCVLILPLLLVTAPVFSQTGSPLDLGQDAAPSTEEDDAAREERFQDWIVRCEDVQPDGGGEQIEVCEMIQDVTIEETGQKIMEVSVGLVPNREMPIVLFTVPLGVRLPPGLLVRVDGSEPVRVEMEFCGPNGCMGSMMFDEDLLARFRAGAEGTVQVRDLREQAHDLPISLMGFSAALRRLRE
ncbi:MAG: invasion associated locus B family protein [Aquisalimonadaceae bacterium]